MATIRHARELGVNTFDTAQVYGWGEAERILGRALRDELRQHREDIVLVTKGGMRISDAGAPYRIARYRSRRPQSCCGSTFPPEPSTTSAFPTTTQRRYGSSPPRCRSGS
jgi:hypothetical protein